MENLVNDFIDLKSKLVLIKEFTEEVIDKPDGGLSGGYYLNKACDELILAIARLEHYLGIFQTSEQDIIFTNAPYKVCVSDIYNELNLIDIPRVDNNHVPKLVDNIQNAKLWILEEVKRLAQIDISL